MIGWSNTEEMSVIAHSAHNMHILVPLFCHKGTSICCLSSFLKFLILIIDHSASIGATAYIFSPLSLAGCLCRGAHFLFDFSIRLYSALLKAASVPHRQYSGQQDLSISASWRACLHFRLAHRPLFLFFVVEGRLSS